MEEGVEQDWIAFMKNTQIPAIMETGLFEDFRFVRIMPGQGVDISYNLQLRCKDVPTLNQYKAFNEPQILQAEAARYQGKLGYFQSTLEQLLDGQG
jgi:hypothetical protein